ncbi:MAG TPA: hypothetical protein VH740_16775 [Vicinamibacterales bacterium]|jgi:hypothetical protein
MRSSTSQLSLARVFAALGAAVLVALPVRAAAQGAEPPARPPLAALAAAVAAKKAPIVSTSGQPPASSKTQTITLKQLPKVQTLGGKTRPRLNSSSGQKPNYVAPLVADKPSAKMDRAQIIPYQPIRAGRPSLNAVPAPLRPNPAVPSVTAPRPILPTPGSE